MIHKMVHGILNIKSAITYVPYQDLENKILLQNLLDTPEDVLFHIRRFTYSLSTQMIFGYRCIDNKDPNLLQLFSVRNHNVRKKRTRNSIANKPKCFEKWGEVAGSSSAQLVDLYPVLQKLPEFIAPNVKYARELYKVERKLYVGHWLRSKKALDAGTGLVSRENKFILLIGLMADFYSALLLQ